MSKKRNTTEAAISAHDWMAPVSPDAACGLDLEYDPEFILLFAQVAARMDAQYGDFVGTSEPVNWSDVDRDCRRLMMRTKDIRLAVLFTRCRTRLNGAAGLAEGLGLLAGWLEVFAQTVHPQPGVDEDHDAAREIRMNALQALTDTEGLMSDVRDIALVRSSASRLTMRDVERAFALPRPADALSVESVTRQLEDMRIQQPELMTHFNATIEKLTAIDTWNRAQLGMFAADLSALTRLLGRVVGEAPLRVEQTDDAHDEEVTIDESNAPASITEPDIRAPVPTIAPETSDPFHASRENALQLIRDARRWFEVHEPSSPIPILLKRAEASAGKRYAELVQAIPVELLIEWDKET